MSPRLVAVLAGACLVLVAGCVRVPEDGPVEETRSDGVVASEPGVFIDPRPPQKGESRADIVDHFLYAMQATPIQFQTAREFLTEDAADAWNPKLETITYSEPPVPKETANGIAVTLEGANRLDERGVWQGALPPDQRTITFPMAMEDGEWRIDAAPNAFIVPEDWFETRYAQANLYFFDPTATILAPEPVWLPRSDQLASWLTKSLVLGPGEELRRVVQSFVPPGLEVVVGVKVSDGVAEIPLEGDAQLTAQTIELMMAQFAWTLRQDPTIESIEVSINGDPVPLPDGVTSYDVDGGAAYDPAGFQSSPLLFALEGGHVVSGATTSPTPVSGPLGSDNLGLRSIGVSLDAGTVAGIGANGTSLLVGNIDGTEPARVRTILSGATDLLRPAWDFADRIWLIDRTTAGARVTYVHGSRMDSLRVPGITGERVRSFAVSRDGTRLVAVVRRDGQDLLYASRIQHSANGRVVGATRAEQIGAAGGDADEPIRDVAWASPERVATLVQLTPQLAEVARISVDGSLVAPESWKTDVDARLVSLAGSPDVAEPLYGLADDALVDVVTQEKIEIDPSTTALVYVG